MGIKRKQWMQLSMVASPSPNQIFFALKELYHVINESCPDAIKTGEIKNQFGRKVAIVSPTPYTKSTKTPQLTITQDA